MRIVGIDHGERRTGLAIGDPSGTIARPLAVIEGEEALLERIEELIREEEVDRLVLGLPRNMDGTIGPKAREVLEFKERLAARVGIPVDLWDERLTTQQAEQLLEGMPTRERRKIVDKVAAQIILQSYLDAHRALPGEPPTPG